MPLSFISIVFDVILTNVDRNDMIADTKMIRALFNLPSIASRA
jgi:hypothetical protein